MYTHVSPILQCIGPCYLLRSVMSIFVYNTITRLVFITVMAQTTDVLIALCQCYVQLTSAMAWPP